MSSQKPFIRTACLVLISLVMMSSMISLAQVNDRTLIAGTITTGSLGDDSLAQVYTFAGVAGQVISLSATTTDTVRLGLVLTNSSGVQVAQAIAPQSGEDVALVGQELDENGVYYLTVLQVGATARAEFELQFTSAQPVRQDEFAVPGELLTATGLQISLTWNSKANLDLEVRDPVGGSLFFSTPSVTSGGTIGPNLNSDCQTATDQSPTEAARWPAGVIPTGSYEILVYYQPIDACPTTEPVSFTLTTVVDGTALSAVQGTIGPNQVYLASFRVNSDGSAQSGVNGVKIDPPTPQGVEVSAPLPLTVGVSVRGSITSASPYDVYTFTGGPGEIVTVGINALSGSLDTLLMVLDPNRNVVAVNDDAARGITNSQVVGLPLVLSGAYTVIATRYGQALGGTEGEYELTLSTGASSVAGTETTGIVPQFADLPNGAVEVSLQWSTGADLQLLVRDPQGDAVFDDRPAVPSGGRLAAQGNVNCVRAEGSPVSYIYWPEGRLPGAGPYEIEVQYQNTCNDPQPVVFTLNVVANEQPVLFATQQIRPGERYVSSFSISVDGQVIPGEGGIFGTVQRPDSSAIDYASQLENARVVVSGENVRGSIRQNRKYDVFVFDGLSGQVATVAMEALNGTLDPVLFLIAPDGVQLAENDDAPGGDTTNALIREFALPDDGRYIIIATHFGGRYGVTAGDYNLTLRLT